MALKEMYIVKISWTIKTQRCMLVKLLNKSFFISVFLLYMGRCIHHKEVTTKAVTTQRI